MIKMCLKAKCMAFGCLLSVIGANVAHAVTDPNEDGAAATVVKNDAAGWMWYSMDPYENPALPDGAAHAGGPGSYAMYTFQGSGVDVYGMRALTIVVDKRSHRVGKVKVTIDDQDQGTVDLGVKEADYHSKIFSIKGLAGGNHVIQISPVGGWAVVDSLTVIAGGGAAAGSALPSSADLIEKKHLVGYWSCGDSDGVTLADKSGHGHTGTFQAGAVVSRDDRAGKNVVSFPKAGGVEIPEPVVDTSKSFTVAAWIKLNSLTSLNAGFQTFVSMDGADQSGFFLQTRDDTRRFALTMHPFHADATTSPVVGQWYHIAGVYDAPTKTLAIFVNGALEGTTQIPGPTRANGATVIGRAKFNGNYTDFVAGSIGDVRMYDVALLPVDIASLYSAGM
ncbi:MAG: LamG domain-containing protein [Capsulimonas sp.]|uniref:LamG domain-containing protein n=1 Tax=Capsulimonas sp. TaxID=2494211 RepID=UPI003263D961